MKFKTKITIQYNEVMNYDGIYFIGTNEKGGKSTILIAHNESYPMKTFDILERVNYCSNLFYNFVYCHLEDEMNHNENVPEIRLTMNGFDEKCEIYVRDELIHTVNLNINNLYELYTEISKIERKIVKHYTPDDGNNNCFKFYIKPELNYDEFIDENNKTKITKCGCSHAIISFIEPIILRKSD